MTPSASPISRRRRAGRPPRLHPRRPERAAGRRRPHHRRHAHPRFAALHRAGAGGRRGGDGHLAPRPADRGRAEARGLARAGRRAPRRAARPDRAVEDELGRRRRRRARASSWCSRTAASTGARRRTIRRWRRRWRRSATSSSTTPSAPRTAPKRRPTASPSSRRSPAPARCSPPRSTRSRRRSPSRSGPLVAIVAGSKVSTKLAILQSLAKKVDRLIVGGGIANTFLLAAGLPIGKSLAEPALVGEARAVIEAMRARGAEVPMPTDVVTAKRVQGRRGGDREAGRRCRRPTT